MQPDAVQPKEDHFLANARAQSVSELSPPDTAAFTAPSAPDQASVPDEAAGMLFGKELEGTPLEVRWCEGRGRGLYATKAVSAGESVSSAVCLASWTCRSPPATTVWISSLCLRASLSAYSPP